MKFNNNKRQKDPLSEATIVPDKISNKFSGEKNNLKLLPQFWIDHHKEIVYAVLWPNVSSQNVPIKPDWLREDAYDFIGEKNLKTTFQCSQFLFLLYEKKGLNFVGHFLI